MENLATITDPKLRQSYLSYLRTCERIDVRPMNFENWRETAARLFSEYRPTVTKEDME